MNERSMSGLVVGVSDEYYTPSATLYYRDHPSIATTRIFTKSTVGGNFHVCSCYTDAIEKVYARSVISALDILHLNF
jgi:hypothetical protein